MSHGQFYFFLANMWATFSLSRPTKESCLFGASVTGFFLVLACLS